MSLLHDLRGSTIDQVGYLSRAAALALLLVVSLVIYAVAVAPLIAQAGRESVVLALSQERLARFQTLAAQIGELERAYDRVRARGPVEGLFLKASSPATASARLQEHIKELVKSSNANITSLFALPPVAKEDHRRIGLRVLMTVDPTSLQRILHGIETAEPVLIVEKLYVRARTARSVNVVRDLDVEIEIVGFLGNPAANNAANIDKTK